MRLNPKHFRHTIGLNKPVGPLRIDRGAPENLLRKLKFLAVFDEGRGAPRDLVSGRFAAPAGGTPGWLLDSREGPFAELRGTSAYWSWTGIAHGIASNSYTQAIRARVTTPISGWGNMMGIDLTGAGACIGHQTTGNNIFFDDKGSTTKVGGTWTTNVWTNVAINKITASNHISFYKDGVVQSIQSDSNGASFGASAEITVGFGQSGSTPCRGDVGLAAIFSPGLTAAESLFFTANPYCLVEAESVPRVWPVAGGAVTRNESASLQAALRRQIGLQAALGAAARATRTLSASSGAALARGQLRSDSLDSVVQALVSAQADLNAALTRSLLAGAGMDANVSQQGLSQRVAALDGAVRRLNALSGALEAALRTGKQGSTQLDSPLAFLVQGSAGLDAAARRDIELPAQTLEAAMRATADRATALDAIIGVIVAAAASRTLNVAAPGRHAVAANRRQVEIPAGKRRH